MRDELKRVYDLRASAETQAEIEEAAEICSRLMNENYKDTEAIFAYGMVMLKCERFGVANAMFARVLELNPQAWEAMVNYALTLISVGEYSESEAMLHKALKMSPDATSALNNLAILNVCVVRPDKAIEYAQKSLLIKAGQAEPLESYGYAQLMLGNFREGWTGYEAMVNDSRYRRMRPLSKEQYWKGETGGRLYVMGEQGLGDEISFASIIPDAAKENEIILDCSPKLEGLFKRSFPQVEVHGTAKIDDKQWKDWRQIDYSCLIGSLASKYRNDAKDFPGTAYLKADPERRVQWRSLLDTLPGKKVGIAWTGGLFSTFTHRRSLSLEALSSILETQGISWVSLQYKSPSAEISRFERKHRIKIHHWPRGAQSDDYDDQAALVSELDAVVSVTTAAVHLCGALGKKCFVLVPSKPRWFYQLSGSALPWYESVQLHRQTDHWPMESVRSALIKYLRLEVQGKEQAA